MNILQTSVTRFRVFAHALMAPRCWLCTQATPIAHPQLCEDCWQTLPWLKSACYRCALPLPQTAHQKLCGDCVKKSPPFDRTIAVFEYAPPIHTFLNALKFQHQLHYSRFLGKLLRTAVHHAYADQSLPTVLLPVPLHKKRLQERGFNQALEIARFLRPIIRINAPAIHRLRDTPHQIHLTAIERRRNLRAAFAVTKPLPEHIAIIDDVVTTTSTISEVCRSLQQAGVKKIDVWCVARTPII